MFSQCLIIILNKRRKKKKNEQRDAKVLSFHMNKEIYVNGNKIVLIKTNYTFASQEDREVEYSALFFLNIFNHSCQVETTENYLFSSMEKGLATNVIYDVTSLKNNVNYLDIDRCRFSSLSERNRKRN